MALQNILLKEDNEYQFTFNTVYYKIDECYIDIITEEIRIGLRGYPDKNSRDNNGIGIYKKIFEVSFTSLNITYFTKNNLLTACYNYLKTLDEFKEAKSV